MITRNMSEDERLAYCQKVLQEQQDSGLTVTQWCKENDIPKARFYRYRKVVLGETDKEPEGGIWQLPSETQPESTGRREMILEVGGLRIALDRKTDWKVLESVVRALQ